MLPETNLFSTPPNETHLKDTHAFKDPHQPLGRVHHLLNPNNKLVRFTINPIALNDLHSPPLDQTYPLFENENQELDLEVNLDHMTRCHCTDGELPLHSS